MTRTGNDACSHVAAMSDVISHEAKLPLCMPEEFVMLLLSVLRVIYVLAYLRTLYQLQRKSHLREILVSRYVYSLRVAGYHNHFFFLDMYMNICSCISFLSYN